MSLQSVYIFMELIMVNAGECQVCRGSFLSLPYPLSNYSTIWISLTLYYINKLNELSSDSYHRWHTQNTYVTDKKSLGTRSRAYTLLTIYIVYAPLLITSNTTSPPRISVFRQTSYTWYLAIYTLELSHLKHSYSTKV